MTTLPQSEDRYVGAWRQNLEKSGYPAGDSASSPSLLDLARVSEAERWSVQGPDAEGKPLKFGYTGLAMERISSRGNLFLQQCLPLAIG